MSYVEELIERSKLVTSDEEYWLKLYEDIQKFRNNCNTSKKDIKKLEKEAYLEKLGMIYNGIMYKKNKISN